MIHWTGVSAGRWCGVLAAAVLACSERAGRAESGDDAEFMAALMAPPTAPRDLSLYAQFLGVWNADVTVYPDSGPPIRSRGEWLFARVMEGWAIQDLFIVPGRSERDSTTTGPYGTTIRFPTPDDSTWQITWLNPVSGAITRMTARRVGTEIIQGGFDDEGRPFRWVFSAIEPSRFRWRAEDSSARGWVRLQEMLVTRRAAPERR